MPQFETSVTIARPSLAVFEFLSRPANLAVISPPQMQVAFIDAPEQYAVGCRVEFEIRGFGPAQRIVHEVLRVEPPRRLTERQIQGPLKHWVHDRLLEPEGDDAVRLIEQIEFEPPGGLLRFLLTEDRIIAALRDSFAHQHQQLRRRLESATAG